jgi:hypothetical protein
MPQNSDNQIALFIRDEKTGRYAFNTKVRRVQAERRWLEPPPLTGNAARL